MENTTPIKSALFVDFDNVYLSLDRQDKDIATLFATDPDKWLSWLEKQLPAYQVNTERDGFRRFLIRKCYLNPQSFSSYRPYFIKSGFEVVDCPPLTSFGKTSTDIHMVMDILDALNHVTLFNEFVLMSGDADFTPVLLRLRKHDRYSVVVSAGYVSPAYKASCDYLIPQEQFIGSVVGMNDMDEEVEENSSISSQPVDNKMRELLGRMANRVYQVVCESNAIISSELYNIYMEFPEFKRSTRWMGFYTLRKLTQMILLQRDDLSISEEDPWKVIIKPVVHNVVTEIATAQMGNCLVENNEPCQNIMSAISIYIKQFIARSPCPVTMASLAHHVSKAFADALADSDWLNMGSFKNLLNTLDLTRLAISSVAPGYVYDPDRHQLQTGGNPYREQFTTKYNDLSALAAKIHHLTDTPYLWPEHYGLLLKEIARELNQNGYYFYISKILRDRCVERGAPIARSHVNFVLAGIQYGGHKWGSETAEHADKLGEAFARHVIYLCRNAQFNLSDKDEDQIREWVVSFCRSD